MNEKLQVYTIINNPIFSEGIDNLILTKISSDAKIVRKENLQDLINAKSDFRNQPELLIYDVVKFSNKDFNHLLHLMTLNVDFKILIITSNINISDVKLLFEIGVMGVINRNILSDQFIDFVEKILKGNKVLSREYWNLIVEYFFHSVENNDLIKEKTKDVENDVLLYDDLTNREKEILGYICDGKSTREISEDLFLSLDRKSTRLNSSHVRISYAVFCLKKKKQQIILLNNDYCRA